ncbi:MAG: hypothetical protein LCH61_14285 [Proteobacteria bacterium]|nr:hypothetical protein [Pseudomonadota bacterium]
MLRLTVLAFALSAICVPLFAAQTEIKRKEFVIDGDDGYGTSDCLTTGSACGKIVADAWCESKGFAKAVAYRVAEAGDVTHSTSRARAVRSAFVISCAE